MAGELWTVHLGVVEYREACALQERVRAARQADAIADTLLLLEHPPVYTRGRRSPPASSRWARSGTGCRGSTSSTSTAAARSPITARASSSATRSCACADVVAYVRTMEQAIVAALVDEGVAGPRARPRRTRLHRRLDRRPQDRLDRRARLARGHDARLRGQRRQRPAALRVGRGVRAAGRAHDVGHARAPERRPPAVLSQGDGLPLRRGPRPSPAARVGGAARGLAVGAAPVPAGPSSSGRRRCPPRSGPRRRSPSARRDPWPPGNGLHDPHARRPGRDHGGDAGGRPTRSSPSRTSTPRLEREGELGGHRRGHGPRGRRGFAG